VMDGIRLTYAARFDATPETEFNALAVCYRFLLDCRAKKEATRPGGPEVVVKESNGYDAATNRTE
jgi:hypothetical protein